MDVKAAEERTIKQVAMLDEKNKELEHKHKEEMQAAEQQLQAKVEAMERQMLDYMQGAEQDLQDLNCAAQVLRLWNMPMSEQQALHKKLPEPGRPELQPNVSLLLVAAALHHAELEFAGTSWCCTTAAVNIFPCCLSSSKARDDACHQLVSTSGSCMGTQPCAGELQMHAFM